MIKINFYDIFKFDADALQIKKLTPDSVAVLDKIQQCLSKVKAIGEDEHRIVYLKYVTDDEERWGWMGSTIYDRGDKQYKTLMFTCDNIYTTGFGNYSNIFDDKEEHDISEVLNKLYEQLEYVIDHLDEYNEWIENNIPYYFRIGEISHERLNDFTDEYMYDTTLSIINSIKNNHPFKFDKMTLNMYGRFFDMAFNSIHGTDEERFISLNFKDMNGKYDLDSEADFIKWYNETHMFHTCEPVYARVFLLPIQKEDGWTLHLSCCGQPWIHELLRAYKSLENNVYVDKEMLLDILQYKDIVGVIPYYNKYFRYSDTNIKHYFDISLGSVEESVLGDFIKAIEWDDINKYKLFPNE